MILYQCVLILRRIFYLLLLHGWQYIWLLGNSGERNPIGKDSRIGILKVGRDVPIHFVTLGWHPLGVFVRVLGIEPFYNILGTFFCNMFLVRFGSWGWNRETAPFIKYSDSYFSSYGIEEPSTEKKCDGPENPKVSMYVGRNETSETCVTILSRPILHASSICSTWCGPLQYSNYGYKTVQCCILLAPSNWIDEFKMCGGTFFDSQRHTHPSSRVVG